MIEINFDAVDYIGETTPCAKFYTYPSMGGASRQMNEIYANFFYLY